MSAGMKHIVVGIVAAAAAYSAGNPQAEAFWGNRRQVVTTAYGLPSVPVTTGFAPVVVARPVVVAPARVVAPAFVPAPVVTSFAPVVAPVPAVTAFPAPQTVFAPVVTPGFVAPAAPAFVPVTSFYAPVPVRVRRPVFLVP